MSNLLLLNDIDPRYGAHGRGGFHGPYAGGYGMYPGGWGGGYGGYYF
jgi:hypothetical protein